MGCLSPSWSSLSSASRLSTPHATCSRGAPCEQPSGVAGRLNRLRLQRQHYAGGLMFVGAPVVQARAVRGLRQSSQREHAPWDSYRCALEIARLILLRLHCMCIRMICTCAYPSGFACAVACASGCACYCMCVHAHVHSTHTFSGLHPHAHRDCTFARIHMPMHVRMRIRVLCSLVFIGVSWCSSVRTVEAAAYCHVTVALWQRQSARSTSSLTPPSHL